MSLVKQCTDRPILEAPQKKKNAKTCQMPSRINVRRSHSDCLIGEHAWGKSAKAENPAIKTPGLMLSELGLQSTIVAPIAPLRMQKNVTVIKLNRMSHHVDLCSGLLPRCYRVHFHDHAVEPPVQPRLGQLP